MFTYSDSRDFAKHYQTAPEYTVSVFDTPITAIETYSRNISWSQFSSFDTPSPASPSYKHIDHGTFFGQFFVGKKHEKTSLPGPFVTWPLWCFALCRDCCLALRSLVPSLRLPRRQREAPTGVDGENPTGGDEKDGGMAGESCWWGYCAMIVHVLWNSTWMSVETIKWDRRNQFEHLLSLWRSHCAILADLDLEATKIDWILLHCHVSNDIHSCSIPGSCVSLCESWFSVGMGNGRRAEGSKLMLKRWIPTHPSFRRFCWHVLACKSHMLINLIQSKLVYVGLPCFGKHGDAVWRVAFQT